MLAVKNYPALSDFKPPLDFFENTETIRWHFISVTYKKQGARTIICTTIKGRIVVSRTDCYS